MKKQKGNILFGIVAVVAIGAMVFLNFKTSAPVETITPMQPIEGVEKPIKSDFEGGSIRSGYLPEMRKRSQIIADYKEFESFCESYNRYAYNGQGEVMKETGKLNALVEKYDKKFFEEKSLAIVYVELGSGSNKVEFNGATRDGNSVTILYKIVYPEGGIGTADMSGYIVFAEVDKDITNIITY